MVSSSSPFEGIKKIRRGPLREQVRDQIKQLILTNQLHPGQSIVIDRLASELGVSHTPVREALAMLKHEGLIQMKPYGNPYVAKIDASDVREVWEMRLLLECWAIRQAALTVPEDVFDKMDKLLEQAHQDAQQSRYDTHMRADLEMHRMILQSTNHHLFQRLATQIEDRSVRIRTLVEAVGSQNDVLRMVDEHQAILEALRCRDADLACERLAAHLEAGMERTLIALDQIASDGG